MNKAKTGVMTAVLVAMGLMIQVCAPDAEEPEPLSLDIVTDNSGIVEVTNDEGWTITLTAFQMALEDIELTTGGETHANRNTLSFLISTANAHPGHSAGGEVIGELSGRFLFDMKTAPKTWGEAVLIPEKYEGMNVHFRRADDNDDLEDNSPLLGHTAYLSGTAVKDDVSIEFEAFVDIDDGAEMIGGPFDAEVDEATKGKIAMQVFTLDNVEEDTMFDGLAFDELDEDDDQKVVIEAGSAAHNILSKTMQRHDHYGMALKKK